MARFSSKASHHGAHIPEKWIPVFRKGYAPTQESGAHPDSFEPGCALVETYEYDYVWLMMATRTAANRLFGIVLAACAGLAAAPATAAKQVIFERDGRTWCARSDRGVGGTYPKIQEDAVAPLRRVNLGRRTATETGLKAPVRFTPTFPLLDKGREIATITGDRGKDAFSGLVGRFLAATDKPAS